MNKELFDQLPPDERSVAERLNSVSENMKVQQAFQWNLESQLMDAYQNKSQPNKGWFSKLIAPAAWTLAAVLGFIVLTWTIRSLASPEQITPAAPNTEIPVETFKSKVRQGNICAGRLALAHGFNVFLTNEDKTAFMSLDEEKAIGELRTFAWSSNGEQLAILGNTTGNGNIYIADLSDTSLQPVLANPDLGYLYDFAWSRDGTQFAVWSPQNNKNIFLFNSDGSGKVEKQLNVQILGTLQFWPDGSSVVFFGATPTSSGLFELMTTDSDAALINSAVESTGSYAFSPDGTFLAYMEYDRDLGEARLYTEDLASREPTWLGTLSIPKGSGAAMPETTNLSWSQDGTKLVFEFGRNAADRAIYLAYADGSSLVKVVESAHAPTISADGHCLAYISSKQIFALDLNEISTGVNVPRSVLLADLPAGGSNGDFRLDKLQWQP